MRSNFPLIEQAHRRLKDVLVENQDFEQLIRHYDRPVSFFYCDPPYHNTEGYYQNIGEGGFTEEDHIRLRDTLMAIEGKFLLSYNDDAFVRDLYDRPGIYIESLTRLNNIKQRYDPNCQFAEVLISNFDTTERQRAMPTQITLSYILRNEHYIGDALLQKTYTTDTLPYRQVENRGEKEQYYLEGSHPAIISKEVFEATQTLIQRRAKCYKANYSPRFCMAGMIRCGNCGSLFKKRINHGVIYK